MEYHKLVTLRFPPNKLGSLESLMNGEPDIAVVEIKNDISSQGTKVESSSSGANGHSYSPIRRKHLPGTTSTEFVFSHILEANKPVPIQDLLRLYGDAGFKRGGLNSALSRLKNTEHISYTPEGHVVAKAKVYDHSKIQALELRRFDLKREDDSTPSVERKGYSGGLSKLIYDHLSTDRDVPVSNLGNIAKAYGFKDTSVSPTLVYMERARIVFRPEQGVRRLTGAAFDAEAIRAEQRRAKKSPRE
jgi:hypothetical protein